MKEALHNAGMSIQRQHPSAGAECTPAAATIILLGETKASPPATPPKPALDQDGTRTAEFELKWSGETATAAITMAAAKGTIPSLWEQADEMTLHLCRVTQDERGIRIRAAAATLHRQGNCTPCNTTVLLQADLEKDQHWSCPQGHPPHGSG